MPVAFLAAALQAAAMSPVPAPVCTAVVAPPAGLATWSKPVDLVGYAGLRVGSARNVALTAIETAKLSVPPSRPAAPGTFAGAFDFIVDKPGTYRVALSAGAWIDLIGNGRSLTSVAHTEGPACSGIRKIVDFALVPGRYTLQLSGAKNAVLRVLIAAK